MARSLIPTPGRFSGTITGGNARAVSPAQTFSYAFDVPRGKKDLDIALTLADPGSLVDMVLVDPDGELADVHSNVFLTSPTTVGQGGAVQTYDASPLPGRWHLVLVVQNPVTGQEIEQPFQGTIGYDQVSVRARGLPAGDQLAAGTAVTVPVTVRNTGAEPIAIGVDARTNRQQTVTAVPIQGSPEVDLPESPAAAPVYLTPPDTSRFTISTSSTVPAQVEMQGSAAGFDPAVTSSTGDPFDLSVDPNGTGGTPSIIQPGRTAPVQATFTPAGHRGDRVEGHLNLVTVPVLPTGVTALPFNGTGEVIAVLPYSYRIT